ncbi:hypothetical protein [Ruthenibacterium lactatiformans]|uniref:hypothetical protein n=1 Tax=Ruthenibacterium lactatiformans TaxID=1550024 RepID=UPI0024951CB4|nr:hypothetical protein [Ruthenibacterium lactatiformans]
MDDLISRSALLTSINLELMKVEGCTSMDVDALKYQIISAKSFDAVPVVHENYCIDIVEFIDWLDVGHLRSADEKCFSERNVAAMVKDFAITNPAVPGYVTRCKECRYGVPVKLFGRDAIACTEQREELHAPEWFCADGAKMDGHRREDTK